MNDIITLTQQRAEYLKEGNFLMASTIQAKINMIIKERESKPITIADILNKMSKEDSDKVNILLNKIPVFADLIDSTATDLLAVLHKYDENYYISALDDIIKIKNLAFTFVSLISQMEDGKKAIPFGNLCDRVNLLVDNAVYAERALALKEKELCEEK